MASDPFRHDVEVEAGRRPGVVPVAIAVVALAGAGLAAAVLLRGGPDDPPPLPPQPQGFAPIDAAARLVTPGVNTPAIPESGRFAQWGPSLAAPAPGASGAGKFAERAPVAGARPKPSGPQSFTMTGPYTFLDGTTFEDPQIRVRLAEVRAPSRHATCIDASNQLWGCGLRARAALANLLQRKTVTCHGDQSQEEPVVATCRIDEGDLAALMVQAGFARPVREGVFQAQEAEARRQKAGLWNGGWAIREPGGTVPEAEKEAAPIR